MPRRLQAEKVSREFKEDVKQRITCGSEPDAKIIEHILRTLEFNSKDLVPMNQLFPDISSMMQWGRMADLRQRISINIRVPATKTRMLYEVIDYCRQTSNEMSYGVKKEQKTTALLRDRDTDNFELSPVYPKCGLASKYDDHNYAALYCEATEIFQFAACFRVVEAFKIRDAAIKIDDKLEQTCFLAMAGRQFNFAADDFLKHFEWCRKESKEKEAETALANALLCYQARNRIWEDIKPEEFDEMLKNYEHYKQYEYMQTSVNAPQIIKELQGYRKADEKSLLKDRLIRLNPNLKYAIELI
jgi:hypothetical protein